MTNKIFKGTDPGLVVVGTAFTARNDVAINRRQLLGELTGIANPGAKLKVRIDLAQQRFEHVEVFAIGAHPLWPDRIGF